MRLLFFLGHPAHFHLFRNVVFLLREHNHDVKIIIKKKDVLEQLLIDAGWEYINILPEGRNNNKLSIALAIAKRDKALWRQARSWQPDILIGTSVEIAHIGWLRRIPSVVVNEDDWDVGPHFSWLVYPFCDHILSPDCCNSGRWKGKSVTYAGYHELTYLHPKYFTANPRIVESLYQGRERYFILRFAQLTAYHDVGISGFYQDLVAKIIQLLEPYGSVYISSERPLEPEFERYRIKIKPLDIHHALAFADLFLGDGQTMTAEAAVLGTPALRFNDFVGRIGYLEELEHRYKLTFGFRSNQSKELLTMTKKLLETRYLREIWKKRQEIMLSDKVDVTLFMVNLFEKLGKGIS